MDPHIPSTILVRFGPKLIGPGPLMWPKFIKKWKCANNLPIVGFSLRKNFHCPWITTATTMLRWCAKLRSAAAKPSQIVKSVSSTRRIFHSAPSLYQPLHFSPNNLNSRSLFNAQTHSPLAAYQCIRSSLLPLSVSLVRWFCLVCWEFFS